jgi:N-acetylmuramoyl-L-alanine amidase
LSNTHRNAGFFVLLAPDVPAVLIETGFLSNPTDERRLSDPRARQAMAGAMADAVDAFFQGPRLYAARA